MSLLARCWSRYVLGLWLLLWAGPSLAAPARAARISESVAEGWLAGVYDRVVASVQGGQAVVIQAHVALCDNSIIPCGAQGDGDNIEKNLYWTTSGAVVGWFRRMRQTWTEVAVQDHRADGTGLLQVRIYRARITPRGALRQRGLQRPFFAYAVIYGWRGSDIDRALASYMQDLYSCVPRRIALADGSQLAGGGLAHLVAWIGHNRMMDLEPAALRRLLARDDGCGDSRKGMIAVACHSGSYLGPTVSAPERVPLLLTDSLLFAGTHAFEGAARAFLLGASLAAIRAAAAHAYADGQKRPFQRVSSAFVNPSHPRWRW